jgi:hypothetical protein
LPISESSLNLRAKLKCYRDYCSCSRPTDGAVGQLVRHSPAPASRSLHCSCNNSRTKSKSTYNIQYKDKGDFLKLTEDRETPRAPLFQTTIVHPTWGKCLFSLCKSFTNSSICQSDTHKSIHAVYVCISVINCIFAKTLAANSIGFQLESMNWKF